MEKYKRSPSLTYNKRRCIKNLEKYMGDPFKYRLKDMENCIKSLAGNSSFARYTLEQEIVFYASAKYIREQRIYKETIEWIAFFEREYDCAGICKTSLFAWTRSIEEGRPHQNCAQGVNEGLKPWLIGLDIGCIGLGILFLVLLKFSIYLWAKSLNE